MSEKQLLPILPLRDPDLVVFPGLFCEIDVGRAFSINAVTAAKEYFNSKIIIAIQNDCNISDPSAGDLYVSCAEAEIRRVIPIDDDQSKIRIILVGTRRGNLISAGKTEGDNSYMSGSVEFFDDLEFALDAAIVSKATELRELVTKYIPSIALEDSLLVTSKELSLFLDNLAGQLAITGKQKLSLLKNRDTLKRLDDILAAVKKVAKKAEESPEPEGQTAEAEPAGQAMSDEIKRLKKTMDAAGMPDEALRVANQELHRLTMMPSGSSEFQVTYNYVETLVSLPWNTSTEDIIDIDSARSVLDSDHYGLEKVKERILEFLAIRKLAPERKGSILCLYGAPGVGKAQPLDAKVLTPNGFVNMGDITVGDIVSTPDGKNAEVVGIFPQGRKDIYSVIFSDGSKTECCKEHLWLVRNRNHRCKDRKGYIKPLEQISENLYVEGGKRKNYSIPMVGQSIDFIQNQELELDPYLVGALLGDGTFSDKHSVAFTNEDSDFVGFVRKELDRIGITYPKLFITASVAARFVDENGLRGHTADTKFVPIQYKFTTARNRLALLQGILDTDGSTVENGHSIEYSSASAQLTNDVKFLVESLGGQAHYYVGEAYYTYKGEKLRGKDRHRLQITFPENVVPFRMNRKLDIYNRTANLARFLPRFIKYIEYVGQKEAKCILIDHPDHLYITDDFIVTHNTSIGQSIARAMGRKFVRMSLGGINDEAEIRGHRRTYVGAIPGKIIHNIKKLGVNNPVYMLDEVDKICSNARGDPASALLEVLDPEQNNAFTDNYLGVPFDLSKVLFIATVNEVAPIIPALKDRLEIIEIPGYSPFDKIRIAKRHLISKQKKENGLAEQNITISDEAISYIIDQYTSEAGVRTLERNCGTVLRKMAVRVASGKSIPEIVSQEEIPELLGPPSAFIERAAERPEVGLSAGLAWSRNGGSLLFIESVFNIGKGEIKLTGNLGDVLKESATTAFTWIKANAEMLGVDLEKIAKHDIHVHLPAGAVPKDGPSAGIAITASILSLIMNKPVRNDVAMTGEITLRGKVLPVGGVKEKILAAHRAGIKEIVFPEQNKHDIDELPNDVKEAMIFTTVSSLGEALKYVLTNLEPTDVPNKIGSGNGETLINISM